MQLVNLLTISQVVTIDRFLKNNPLDAIKRISSTIQEYIFDIVLQWNKM